MSGDRKMFVPPCLLVKVICGAMFVCLVSLLASPAFAQETHAAHEHVHGHAGASSSGGFFSDLFKVYTPRQICMFYEQPVIWLHAISDGLIAIAYFTIPFVLVRMVRVRRDMTFGWAFWMFAAFILGCGVTHVIGIVDLWYPLYKVDGIAKLFTGLVSIATAVAIWPLVGKVSAFQSPAQLQQTVQERTAELARVNEQLRRQTELLRAINEGSDDLIYAKDRDGRMVFANPATLRAIGRTETEVLGKSDLEFAADPEHGRRIIANDAKVVESGATQDSEEEIGPAGGVRVYASRKSPLRDAVGNVIGILGVSRDMTDYKRAAEDVRRSEAMLSAVLESLPVSVVIAEKSGRLVRMNQACAEVWGRAVPMSDGFETYDEWIGFYPESGHQLEPHEWPLSRAILHGEVVKGEVVEIVRFGDQRRRLVELTAAPVRGPSGEVLGGVVATLDVTERLAAERALRENEQRLRLAAEAAGVGFWAWDVEGRVSVLDETGAALLGATTDAPQSVAELMSAVHPDDRERVESAARQALTTFERYEAEFRVVHRDGSIRWLAGLGNVVRQDRKPVRLAGVNWDITARKQAESEREQLLESERAARTEAERASRLKDEFLSTVSHELRTPLNAILGWSQLLKGRDTAGDEDLAMGLAVIDRNARAQVQLIEDLLDMGRIISGKVRLELRELDLQEVIHIAVSSVAPSAEAKGVRLLKSLSSRSIIVRGDPDRLQQVVWNLVSNGIKFTPKGGEIRVTVQPEGDMAEFSVSDTGQGIKSEFLPYVFDRFRQADGSTTRKYGGLGLGLAIVKNLVELHGGNVRIASGGEGLGATVTVQIPLSSASMPAGGSGREAKAGFTEQTDDDACSHFNLSGLTVLIVDDAADARDILARMLEDCHVRVQQASSAEEAMSILSEERTDVLVSDIGMPEMDGYEFIRRVRAQTDGKSRNVPAVALTAFARSEDRTRALLAGFQMHLAKPVQPTELMAAIGSLAGKTRIS